MDFLYIFSLLIGLSFATEKIYITQIVDDTADIFINGEFSFSSRILDWNVTTHSTNLDTNKTNLIAIQAENILGMGGLIAEVKYMQHYSCWATIYTGSDEWKGSENTESEDGWNLIGYDDSNWTSSLTNAGKWRQTSNSWWNTKIVGAPDNWLAHWIWVGEIHSGNSSFRLELPTEAFFAYSLDDISTVYLNGKEILTSNQWEVMQKRGLNLRPGKNIIAVYGIDEGLNAGMLAEFTYKLNTRILSGCGAWKSTNTLEPNWNELDFDDSHWTEPDVIVPYGNFPWESKVINIPDNFDGKWIWSSGNTNESWFRLEFNTDTFCPERHNCGNILGFSERSPFVTCLNVVESKEHFEADWFAFASPDTTNSDPSIKVYWEGIPKSDSIIVHNFSYINQSGSFQFPSSIVDFPGRVYKFISCSPRGTGSFCNTESQLRRSFVGSISGTIESQRDSVNISGARVILSSQTYNISYDTDISSNSDGYFVVKFMVTLMEELVAFNQSLDVNVTVLSNDFTFSEIASVQHKGETQISFIDSVLHSTSSDTSSSDTSSSDPQILNTDKNELCLENHCTINEQGTIVIEIQDTEIQNDIHILEDQIIFVPNGTLVFVTESILKIDFGEDLSRIPVNITNGCLDGANATLDIELQQVLTKLTEIYLVEYQCVTSNFSGVSIKNSNGEELCFTETYGSNRYSLLLSANNAGCVSNSWKIDINIELFVLLSLFIKYI